MSSSGTSLGLFKVTTSSGGGHPVAFWVDDITAQIIHVSNDAPAPIRDQALAYRDSVRAVLAAGIRNAVLSNHTTIIHQLTQAGMHEAAALVLTMRD